MSNEKWDELAKEHRVSDPGAYNRHVTECAFCGANLHEGMFGEYCLGFTEPPQRAALIEKVLAVVYRCPECLERQWSHCTITGGYHRYLRYLYEKGELKL